jgi:hypothetical protein
MSKNIITVYRQAQQKTLLPKTIFIHGFHVRDNRHLLDSTYIRTWLPYYKGIAFTVQTNNWKHLISMSTLPNRNLAHHMQMTQIHTQWKPTEWLQQAMTSHSVPYHWMEIEWLVSFTLQRLDKSSVILFSYIYQTRWSKTVQYNPNSSRFSSTETHSQKYRVCIVYMLKHNILYNYWLFGRHSSSWFCIQKKISVVFSPLANYTDRAIAAGQRS